MERQLLGLNYSIYEKVIKQQLKINIMEFIGPYKTSYYIH